MEFEDTDIYQAILDNDTETLAQLLASDHSAVLLGMRGLDGQNYLHLAVDVDANKDIVQLLLARVDISCRDQFGETPYDMSLRRASTEVTSAILAKVGAMVIKADMKGLQQLFISGWQVWQEDWQTDDVPPEALTFLQQIPDMAATRDKIHRSIESGKDATALLNSDLLVRAADITGLPPLHKAVIFRNRAFLDHILTNFPHIINFQDNLGRTALHYASVLDDNGELHKQLLALGASPPIKDLAQNTAQGYQENPELLALPDLRRRLKVFGRRTALALSRRASRLSLSHPAFPTSRRISQIGVGGGAGGSRDNRWQMVAGLVPLVSRLTGGNGSHPRTAFEDTPLYEAILTNNVDEVRSLVYSMTARALAQRSVEGWSYLHLAVQQMADPRIINLLLPIVNMAIRDTDGQTALDMALTEDCPEDIATAILEHILRLVAAGKTEVLMQLARQGWSHWPPKDTPHAGSNSEMHDLLKWAVHLQARGACLHQAVMTGDLQSAQCLLTDQDIACVLDHSGLSPLHKTIIFQQEALTNLILQQFPASVDVLDSLGRAALHYAAALDDRRMFQTLHELSSNPDLQDTWGYRASDYQNQPTLLHLPSAQAHVKQILAHTSPPHLIWPRCLSAVPMEDSKLLAAVKEGKQQEVEALLQTEEANLRSKDGQSLLHMAVLHKAPLPVFKALLEKVDLAQRDKDGQTVLDLLKATDNQEEEAEQAVMEHLKSLTGKQLEEMLEKLLLAGWNHWPPAEGLPIPPEQYSRFTVEMPETIAKLHQAVMEGQLREVQGLLGKKSLAKAADKTGMPLLHKAVIFQHPDVVKALVKDFPDILDATDHMGRTALHYAGGCHDGGHLYAILKEAGAKDDIPDLTGKTPKDYYDNSEELSVMKVRERVEKLLGKSQEQAPSPAASPSPSPSSAKTEASTQSTAKPASPKREPVKMYIPCSSSTSANVPPPSTVDGKYVAQHLGTALTLALAEIAERRPWDPIEYLASWLYKYRENLDYTKSLEKSLDSIRNEEAEKEQIELNKAKRKAEQKQLRELERQKQKEKEEEEARIRREEEQQKKAKELALAQKPALPTVTEEGEEENTFRERDETGQTELHRLAAQQGADLVTLLNMGFSLADRDAEGKTARDIAQEHGLQENVEAIDTYVSNLLEQEKTDVLQQLLLEGYDGINTVLENSSTDGLPQDIRDFIDALPEYQERVSKTLAVAKTGGLHDVAQALERKQLASAKDQMGRSPLHLAVLAGSLDTVQHITQQFPHTVKCRDNLNRTPLHYATAVSEEIAEALKGADSSAKDVFNRTPDYYADNPEDIAKMKEELEKEAESKADATDNQGESKAKEDEEATAAGEKKEEEEEKKEG